MIAQRLVLLAAALLITTSTAQSNRRAIVVDLSACQNPKAVQPNIQTIEQKPDPDFSTCGLRDTSDFCSHAADYQIQITSSSDGSIYTFEIPLLYKKITNFVWLQEEDFPQYWDDPVQGVGGTIATFQNPGESNAIVRAKGQCPNGKECHEADGFVIRTVYFESRSGGVIGPDRSGVVTSYDQNEKLIIKYC